MDTDLLIGSLLKKFENIDTRELQEILDIQRQLSERGKGKKLGEIAKQKGLINKDSLDDLIRKQQELVNNIYKLHNYEIKEKIATGGMGVIYKATHNDTGATVAIKIMSTELSHNPKYVSRFRSEMRIVSSLRHPNLVAAIDSGEINGLLYYAMEYVDGISAFNLMQRKNKLEEREVLKIARSIAKILCYLNDHGIVHRDIKPQNILITKAGAIKLCDLGTAKGLDEARHEETTNTGKGNVIGTPLYMSPEQAMARKLDIRSDLYSFGVTLYHLATGDLPLKGTPTEIMISHARDKLPPPKRFNPQLSDNLNNLIVKLTEKDPADRFQSPLDLLIAVNKLLGKPSKAKAIRRELQKVRLYCKYYKQEKNRTALITTSVLLATISAFVLYFLLTK